MLSRSVRMPSRREGPPSIWDTHGKSGNVLANPDASSTAPYPQDLTPWSSSTEEPPRSSTVEKSERRTQDQDPRCQSAAKNSDQQRLQISDLHFDKIPHTINVYLLEDKIQDWGMYLFTISNGSYAVDQRSGDGWISGCSKSSFSTRGIRMPDFEVLDARIASALNRIIHHSHFKRRVSLEEQKSPKGEPFPSRKTDCLLDLRVLPGHKSQRFCRESCRPLYNWSSNWWYSGIRFEVGRNSTNSDENPIWWHLGRIVQIKNTRVWETQDRIGIVQCGDSSEERWTWWSQIEDNGKKKYRVSSKIYETRTLEPEVEIMKETPWSRIRGQNSVDKEFLEIFGNENPTGNVWKETIAVSVTISTSVEKWHSRIHLRILSCSRMRKKRREPEVPEEKSPSAKNVSIALQGWPCKDYLKGHAERTPTSIFGMSCCQVTIPFIHAGCWWSLLLPHNRKLSWIFLCLALQVFFSFCPFSPSWNHWSFSPTVPGSGKSHHDSDQNFHFFRSNRASTVLNLVDACRLLGLFFAASHGSDSSWDWCRMVRLFTEWVDASSFKVILARPSLQDYRNIFSTGTFSSGTSGSRRFSHILLHERIRRRIRLCHFCTLINIVTILQLSPSEHCPLTFPLPTISNNSLSTLFCPLILDHGVSFIISTSGSKVLVS